MAMTHNYEDIVREWYIRLRPEFLRRLTMKYSGLTLFDAENLYQDAFLAVQDNLKQGRVKEDTSWSNYIMTIGMNLANKAWRKIGITNSVDDDFGNEETNTESKTSRKATDILKTLSSQEEETSIYKNEEAISLLGSELAHTPEPCCSIIRLFYYDDMSMDEIAEEIGYKNATTAKAKKSQCMADLISRVTHALHRIGFDVKQKKRNRNGKN